MYGNMFNFLILFTVEGGGIVLIKSRTVKQVTFLGQELSKSPSLKGTSGQEYKQVNLVLLHWKTAM